MDALVEPTVGRWFPPDVLKANPPYVDRIRQMVRTTPVNGFIGCAAALADHDYAAAVATVKRPVLFMVGEKDGVDAGRDAQAAARRCRAHAMSSCPAPGISPTSTSRRLSPRRSAEFLKAA